MATKVDGNKPPPQPKSLGTEAAGTAAATPTPAPADAGAPATAAPAQKKDAAGWAKAGATAQAQPDGSVNDPFQKARDARLMKEATIVGPKVVSDAMAGLAKLGSAATNKLFKGAVSLADEAKNAAEAVKTGEAAADAGKGGAVVADVVKGGKAAKAVGVAAKGGKAAKAVGVAAKGVKVAKAADTGVKGARALKGAGALKDVAPEVAKEVLVAAEKAAAGKGGASALAKLAESTSNAAKSATKYFSTGFLDMKEAEGLAKTVGTTEDGAKFVAHAKDAFRLTKTVGYAFHGLNGLMSAYDLGREYQVERDPKSTSTQKWASRITLAGDALMFTGNPPLMLIGALASTGGALFRDSTHPMQDIDKAVGSVVDKVGKAAGSIGSLFGGGSDPSPAPAQ